MKADNEEMNAAVWQQLLPADGGGVRIDMSNAVVAIEKTATTSSTAVVPTAADKCRLSDADHRGKAALWRLSTWDPTASFRKHANSNASSLLPEVGEVGKTSRDKQLHSSPLMRQVSILEKKIYYLLNFD